MNALKNSPFKKETKEKKPCPNEKRCAAVTAACDADKGKDCSPVIPLRKDFKKEINPNRCPLMPQRYPDSIAQCDIPEIRDTLKKMEINCTPQGKCVTEFLDEDIRQEILKYRGEKAIPKKVINEIWSHLIFRANVNRFPPPKHDF